MSETARRIYVRLQTLKMSRRTTKTRPPASNKRKGARRTETALYKSVSSHGSNASLGALVGQVCSMTDPFCPHAVGGKIPDTAGVRSLAYPVHSRSAMTTNALGGAVICVVPQYLYEPVVAGTILGSTATFTTMVAASRLPNIMTYRIVSMGVKLRRISAPLSSSGMVHIRGFATRYGVSMNTVDTSTYNADFSMDIPLQDTKEVCVVGKTLDERFMFFSPPTPSTPTANVTDWVSPGWGSFTVSVVGGPASVGVLDVELFYNMEVTFPDSESNALLTTPAPIYNPGVKDAVAIVNSEAKNVFIEGANRASQYIARAAMDALVTTVAARFGLKAPVPRARIVD